MKRADVALVENGYASSRSRAQDLIASGRVSIVRGGERRLVTKPSTVVTGEDQLEVARIGGDDFVSRGGHKMRGALDRVRFDSCGARVLDVGISTGGFTDCLLRAGAERVVGVDVGHGQLAAVLKSDPRVYLLEGINARELSDQKLLKLILGLNEGRKFDLIVVDVSFISLTLVLPELIQYLGEGAAILALVKPQFEVGRAGIGKNGIVKDAALFSAVEEKIRGSCRENNLTVEDYFASSIEGTDGNREFFIFAKPLT